jgi:hypothetical protein
MLLPTALASAALLVAAPSRPEPQADLTTTTFSAERLVLIERDPTKPPIDPPKPGADRLEPPRAMVLPRTYLGPDWRHGKAWCGPQCPERNVHYVSSGLRASVAIAPQTEAFFAAGPLFGALWRQRPLHERVNGYALAGVQTQLAQQGRLVVQLGYSPAFGFDANGTD